jgi:hypothetical protein
VQDAPLEVAAVLEDALDAIDVHAEGDRVEVGVLAP